MTRPVSMHEVHLRDVLHAIHELRDEMRAGFTASAAVQRELRADLAKVALTALTLQGRLDSGLDLLLEHAGLKPIRLEPNKRNGGACTRPDCECDEPCGRDD